MPVKPMFGALFVALALSACTQDAAQPVAKDAPAAPTAQDTASAKPEADSGNGMTVRDTTAVQPALSVPTVDGGNFDLSAHRGQWVVVNFWATWCAPCLKEMPELSALDAMREDIAVVGLAYEDTTPQEMTAFLKEHPVVYPIAIVDVMAPPADFATPRGLPMTYLIDPEGHVAKQFAGPVTAKDIEALIAESKAGSAG